MGIVRKILGDEKLTKTELINIKEVETEESRDLIFGTQKSTEVKEDRENLTTADLIPKLHLTDYSSYTLVLRLPNLKTPGNNNR